MAKSVLAGGHKPPRPARRGSAQAVPPRPVASPKSYPANPAKKVEPVSRRRFTPRGPGRRGEGHVLLARRTAICGSARGPGLAKTPAGRDRCARPAWNLCTTRMLRSRREAPVHGSSVRPGGGLAPTWGGSLRSDDGPGGAEGRTGLNLAGRDHVFASGGLDGMPGRRYHRSSRG